MNRWNETYTRYPKQSALNTLSVESNKLSITHPVNFRNVIQIIADVCSNQSQTISACQEKSSMIHRHIKFQA